jgi:HTH-type transcriptional regulator / antitoxin HigA
MRILALKTLRLFWEQQPDVRQAFQAWYRDAKRASWTTPADIRTVYRNASFVGNNRVVFNIRGNQYRLVVAINDAHGIVYIRFVGSHQDDDKIDAATIWEDRAMEIRPIRTEADYQAALLEIEHLFDAAPNTPLGDRLDVLTTLVEAYEAQHYSLPAPDPLEALTYHLESRRLSRRDLEPYLGSRARVAEVLNRKRPLSLEMIRRLHTGLGIEADILIQPDALATSAPNQRRQQTRWPAPLMLAR